MICNVYYETINVFCPWMHVGLLQETFKTKLGTYINQRKWCTLSLLFKVIYITIKVYYFSGHAFPGNQTHDV